MCSLPLEPELAAAGILKPESSKPSDDPFEGMNVSKTRPANVNVKTTKPTLIVNDDFLKPLSSYDVIDPKYIIDRFLVDGVINTLYGDGGQGKSFLALYIAVLVALGLDFLDRTTLKGKVLYLDYELSANAQRQRLEMICQGLDINADTLFDSLIYFSPGLDDSGPAALLELIPVIRDRFDLVIIDSLGAALIGDAESAKDICTLFQGIRQLGTVLVIDHQSKTQKGEKSNTKTIFGSVYKTNLSRNVWHINSIQSEPGNLKTVLEHRKTNLTDKHDAIGLEMHFKNGSFTINGYQPGMEFADHMPVKSKIESALAGLKKATAAEIAEEIDEALGTVKTNLSLLNRNNKIKVVDKDGKANIYAPK